MAINDLLEAYGLAVLKRDELRQQLTSAPSILAEYEDRCHKLEDDIIKMLASVSTRIIR